MSAGISLATSGGPLPASDPNTGGDQSYPALAALSDGGWVVVWQVYNADLESFDVRMQRFDASGAASGGVVQVNEPGDAVNYLPSVQATADGGWTVSWLAYESLEGDDYAWGLFSRSFDAQGQASGAPAAGGARLWSSDLSLPGGELLRVYADTAPEGGDWFEIFQQRFDSAGAPVGEPVQVNTFTPGYQAHAAVGGLKDGGWVVVWSSTDQDGSDFGVFQRRFDADGRAVGPETQVNTFALGSQLEPEVAGLADGGWVVSWMSFGQDGDGWGIFQQRFDAEGQAVGPEMLVNVDPDGPSIAMSAVDPGQMHIGTDRADDVDGSGASEIVLGNAGDDTLDGAAGDDTLAGGTGRDSLQGGDGDDVVSGGSGDDLIVGGSGRGDDTYAGGLGVDTVRYTSATAAIDIDLASGTAGSRAGGDAAGIGSDRLSGIENVIAGSFADRVTGDAFANDLRGMGGRDDLRGGAGDDTLRGGAGADSLAGGGGRDQLSGGAGHDVFVFTQVADSRPGAGLADLIVDFSAGDRIDLSRIDAAAGRSSNDAFRLLDAPPEVGRANGVLWFVDGVLYGSTDRDAEAEFAIVLRGVTSVGVDDIIL
jgi:hypothetical protein